MDIDEATLKTLIKEYIKENLQLNVITKEAYSDSKSDWYNYHRVQLLLEGEVISEEYIE